MKYNFIVNPNSRSKKGAALWKEIESELVKREVVYEVFHTRYRKNATDITLRITGDGKEHTIVVVGGDGTVNEVLNGIKDLSKVILGYIPTGSGNDFARGMKLPTNTVEALENILNSKNIRKMDVGELSYYERQKRFGVSAGIGFDAIICHQASVSKLKIALNKIGLGKLTYAGIALYRLIKGETVRAEVILDDGKPMIFENTYFAAVLNQPYEGGGFKFCPKADSGDGQLDVIVVSGISRLKVILLLPLAFAGWHTWHKGISIFRCRKAEIRTARSCAVHTDGEAVFLKKKIEAYVLPEQIRVIAR